ncbi:MAG: galactose mutarotase [Propionibacteriaceae bacterium]|nr:galactose mutarotase [Propionibacteriaceae bacterium]
MKKVTLGAGEVTAEIWSRGAAVNDFRMPDRAGRVASVILGYDHEEDRVAGAGYLGEICGPFANRIAAGGYVIDGVTYTPTLNDLGTATLHGGDHGWSTQEWTVVDADDHHVSLRLDWSDPDDGFPGPIHARVQYRLDGWSLTHTVSATVDSPTVLNVVCHPYFNLSGTGCVIDDHELTVRASAYLPIDQASIPVPQAPSPVRGSPFDFTTAALIGSALADHDVQVRDHAGIDHAFILDSTGDREAARLHHPGTGRTVDIHTDYPAVQVYSGQFLCEPSVRHPTGAGAARTGIALETEEYPDSPRRPDFPSTLVRPGQVYARTTTWLFSIH